MHTAAKNKPICIYDSTPRPMNEANPWFQLGASVNFHAFRAVYAVDSAAEFFEAVAKHPGCEVRAWGHGGPGAPYMGREVLRADHPAWANVKRVRFSMCSVGQGARGIEYVNALAARGIEVIAHLGLIGFFGCHSHTYGVRAHARATWPATFKPSRFPIPFDSHPFAPRTVAATDMTNHDWFFAPFKK